MHIYILENSGSPHDAGIFSIVDVLDNLEIGHTILLGKKNYSNFKKIKNNKLNFQRLFIVNLINIRFFNGDDYLIIYNTTSTRNALINLFISLLFFGKNIYYIRNANSWINYCKNDKSKIYTVLRFLVYLSKRIMLKTRKFLLVEKETIQKFLINNGYTDVVVMPYIFYKNELQSARPNKRNVYVITCPGIIDLSRKNLIVIYQSMKQMLKVRNDLRLVFLGRPKTETDRKFCEKLKKEFSGNFIYFDEYISDDEYKEYTQRSDIIIGSYYTKHQCEYFDEIYGTTKGSGVDAHAISNSKVLLVNSDYEVDEAYSTSTLKFKDQEDLSLLLSRFVEDEYWRYDLMRQAEKNSKNYCVTNFVQQFKEIAIK